jgi:hypothetical protein
MAQTPKPIHHFRLRSEPLASREVSFSSAEKSQKRRGVILLQRSSFPPDFFGTKTSNANSNQTSILHSRELYETFGNPNAKELLEKKRKLNKFLSRVNNRQSFLKTMANNQLAGDRTQLSKKSDQQSTQETPKFQQQKPDLQESRNRQIESEIDMEMSLGRVKNFAIRPGNFFIQKRLNRAEDSNSEIKRPGDHFAFANQPKRFIDNSESIFEPFSKRKNSEDINRSLAKNTLCRKFDTSVQTGSQTRAYNTINDRSLLLASKPLLSLKSKLKSTVTKNKDNSGLTGNFSFTKPAPDSFLFTMKSVLKKKTGLPDIEPNKDSSLMRKAYPENNSRRLDDVIELKQILDSKNRNVLKSPAKAFSRPIVPSLLKGNVTSVVRTKR